MTACFLILLIVLSANYRQLDANNKALFYVPTLSFSHAAFNIRLAELLARNGYEVTLLVIDIDPNVRYGKTDKAKLIHVPVGLEKDRLKKTLWNNPGPYEDASPLNPKIFLKFLRISQIMIDACFNLFQNHSLIMQLEKEEFQLGYVEQYDACGLGLLQRIEVKTIVWLSATGLYRLQPEAIGINYPISYVPELFSTFSHRMSLLQRLENLLIAMVTEITHKIYSIDAENRLIRQSSVANQLRLSLLVYAANTAGVIANVSPLFDFPAPTSLAIVPIAGITVEKHLTQDDLPTEWKQLADRSTEGFVLITFGSIAKTSEMPKSMWEALEHAFLKFPKVNFIIKHEESRRIFEQWKENVYFTEWIPQVQLMSHSNYRGVLTHGGWSTILESIMYKRSMILMPLFADHFKNAKVVEEKGLGLIVDKTQIRNNTFADAFEQILLNESFVLQCRKYAQMFQENLLVTTEQLVLFKTRSSLKQSTASLSRFYHPKQLKLSPLTVAYFDLCVLLSFLIFIIRK